QRSSGIDEFSALYCSTATENMNRHRQPGPLPPLTSGSRPNHADLSISAPPPSSKLHLGCQILPEDPKPSTQNRYPSPTMAAKPLTARVISGAKFDDCSLPTDTVTLELI